MHSHHDLVAQWPMGQQVNSLRWWSHLRPNHWKLYNIPTFPLLNGRDVSLAGLVSTGFSRYHVSAKVKLKMTTFFHAEYLYKC